MSDTPKTDAEVIARLERERDEYLRQLLAATSALRQIHLEVGDWIRSTVIVKE